MRLNDFLAKAEIRLAASLSADVDVRLETRVLAKHGLGVTRAWLVAHGGDTLEPGAVARLDALVGRRASGEPVAYILGEREFYGRSFRVDPATLIPRPETEHLIDAALARLPSGRPARVLDLGTGSGCVAITLKLERPELTLAAVDISAAALAVARANGQHLAAAVEWLQGDLFAPLQGRLFDLIVSNPPYVAAADRHLGQGDCRFEPGSALRAGADGLDVIRRLIRHSPAYLEAGGWLLLEHGWDQGEAVGRLLTEAGFSEVFMARDLAGQPRVGGGRRARR